ncbi:MAG: hypothetical protein PHG82_02915 [Candidatus Gracilibacteria bacterium]|nr:hypothetical protein [Candidatus Gracilibacteria bacterium]
MKEKIIKFLEYIEIKNIKRKLCILFILIISLYGLVFIYSLIFEQEKMSVDRYNFEQLEEVKNTLNKLDKNSYTFDNVKEFNNKYNKNIKPIKNCYFLSDRNGYFENKNGGGGYIFGFKLESLIYKFIYFGEKYSYPKYDLPINNICGGGTKCDYDITLGNFIKTITNPCRD